MKWFSDVMYFGDNTYLSVKTAAKVSISNNQLVVKDNGKDLPVFSLFKKYSRFDTHVLKGKNYKATVKITDKQNSFVVALMKYTGTEAVAPSPETERLPRTFSLKVYHSQFNRASQLDFWLIQTLMMAFICKAEQTENLCLRLL